MSTGVNVLRWSALVFGVFYGVTHQASLNSSARQATLKQDYDNKEKLVQKAKAEFAKRTMPEESKTASGQVISDPQDPHFDLEAYLTTVAADSS